MVRKQFSRKSLPNERYSLFWQEKARSQGTSFTLQGPSPAKRRQIAAGGSLMTKYPDPAQLLPPREPGTQDSTSPQASRDALWEGGGVRQVPQAATQADSHCYQVSEATRAPQLSRWPKPSWAGGPGVEGQRPLLTLLHQRTTIPLAVGSKWLTNGGSSTVGCLWARPMEASTNGWAGPLTVS